MLSQFYAPLLGGEERYVQDLSHELAARGHTVTVVTLWYPDLTDREEDNGVTVYRVRSSTQRASWLYTDPVRAHAPPAPDPELLLSLRRIIARERPQIVHAHNWILHSFLPLKRWSHAKLVVTLHDYSLSCATKKLVFHDKEPCTGPGFRKCLGCGAEHYGVGIGISTVLANWGFGVIERRAVDMFIPVSTAVARRNNTPLAADRTKVLYAFLRDGIDEPQDGFDAYVDQLPTEPYILFVGALASYKGVDVLIDAYRHLHEPPPLVLIGYETGEFPLATTNFPPGVVIFRNWPHEAVLEAWRRCIIASVPSVWEEPGAVVALEAMAMGKPVIVSNMGGLPELVGDAGFVVQPGDAEALRQAIERLLSNSDLRARVGAAAAARSHLFRAKAVIPQFEAIYRQLLGEPAPGSHGGSQYELPGSRE